MSEDKDYRVLIHREERLLATYTLHTELENGEYLDVSVTYNSGEPNLEPIEMEDEFVDLILKSDSAHGKEVIDGYTIEWFLLN